MVTAAGWPLTIMLTPRKDFLGYGTPDASQPYPGFGGFIRWGSHSYYAWCSARTNSRSVVPMPVLGRDGQSDGMGRVHAA